MSFAFFVLVSTEGLAPVETKVYNYEDETWTDLLTSYDGENIEYDEIGNPTAYLGYSMSWNGRELASLSGNGITVGYKYDSDGLRSYKKVGDTETYYQYVGDRLMYEKRGDIDLRYGYNSFGDLAVIKYTHDGTTYTYYVVCNSRGDVENIYHSNGTVICHYTYDSWGNVISATDANGNEITNPANIGLVNPIRYRGYYYDSETGYYYLQSRYYNPQVGRCINADTSDIITASPMELSDKNLYAYCDNNPVTRIDTNGKCYNVIIGAAVGALVGAAGQIVSDIITSSLTGEITFSNWQTYVGAITGGAIGGAVLGATGNVALSNAVTGLCTTGIGLSLEKLTIKSYDKSWLEISANAVIDCGIAYGLGKLPGVNGITKGRNNDYAVFKSGLTKLRNGTASKMSSGVIRKGIKSSFHSSLFLDEYYGIKQRVYPNVRKNVNKGINVFRTILNFGK